MQVSEVLGFSIDAEAIAVNISESGKVGRVTYWPLFVTYLSPFVTQLPRYIHVCVHVALTRCRNGHALTEEVAELKKANEHRRKIEEASSLEPSLLVGRTIKVFPGKALKMNVTVATVTAFHKNSAPGMSSKHSLTTNEGKELTILLRRPLKYRKGFNGGLVFEVLEGTNAC